MADLTFLLDTNTISEPARKTPNRRLLAKLEQYQSRSAISSLTWHELLYGVARMPEGTNRRGLELYLFQGLAVETPILPYDQIASEWHAAERARLAKSGIATPFVDGQIAAIAATNQLILVTNNVADFRFFAGLQVENWIT